VGLNREVGQPHRGIIKALNSSKKPILAVDVPSGLDATTGEIHGSCIKAYKTVTFSFPKTGFYQKEGPSYIGKLVVADIGIPQSL
jgi:NAD(P)H-hydrate epimerase